MRDPDIYDKAGYFKNPTAINLSDCIDGDGLIFEGHRVEGRMTYVMDAEGNIIFGKRSNPNNSKKRAPHPTLIGGKNPLVQCAGMITFRKGKILSVDNRSGHFRPHIKSLDKVINALQTLCDINPNLFDKRSIWRKHK